MTSVRLPDLDLLVAERCRRSYRYFVQAAWPNVPRLASIPLRWNWHHDAICDHLEAVARADIRYLLINQPPRSLKTELSGVFFLPWVWTWRPPYKVISASVVQAQATETSVFCRQVIESDWYQRLFAREWSLLEDKNAKHDFGNEAGGLRFATSVGGTVIGKGGDLIVADDLQKDGDTQAEWDRAWTYFSGTLSSRADDPATVAKVVVQQRLGKGDISDRILEHGGYVHLKIPTRYDAKKAVSTPLFTDPRTEYHELLNPRRDPPEVARQTVEDALSYSRGMGPVKFRAQHDQDPDEDEGGEFKRSYWRFYRDPRYSGTHRPPGCVTAAEHPAIELPAKLQETISSMDTAVEDTEDADWTVIGAIARWQALRFIRYVDRQQCDIMGMIAMLKACVANVPGVGRKFVERKASGSPLLQLMRKHVSGLQGSDPGRSSKLERARANILPPLSAGQLLIPEGAPWTDDLVAEVARFPKGTNDDQVDMLSQGLSKLETSALEDFRASSAW